MSLRLPVLIFLLIAGLVGTSCASFGVRRSLDLRSLPEGAEVIGPRGEVLGNTPLQLEGDLLAKVMRGSRAEFTVGKSGYERRTYSIELEAMNEFSVNLEALDASALPRAVLLDYQKEINKLVREVLSTQAILLGKNAKASETALERMIQVYPTLSAPQVLLAQLLLARGETDKARQLVNRAIAVDPDDPVAQRLIQRIKSGGGRTQ